MTETFEQLEIAAVREGTVDFSGSFGLLGAKLCDPGRFEVMLDVMKLQGLVTEACSLWKRPSH
jgi:hypothetical protein